MTAFVQRLLQDIQSLEYMLQADWIEKDTLRIGVEQEMCIVDAKTLKPAPLAMEALAHMQHPYWLSTELAQFNLEVNLDPLIFRGDCLRVMEKDIREKLRLIQGSLRAMGADLVLTGILPTIRKYDLEDHNLTPLPRYRALMQAINEQLIGSAYELRVSGIDELLVKHRTPLLEACNTSFQVHLQVHPQAFVRTYNIAQAVTAPVMAAAANSPIAFGKRLWHESRIALFQQAIDTRTTHEHMRERSPRVSFGTDWLEDSILEIYKEDIARFRVLLTADTSEQSLECITQQKVPDLKALKVHNSTVYRWNRPCYGISDNGQPHLRIENRFLPAGPSVTDEVANAAFWLGLISGMADEQMDFPKLMSWEDVRDNFAKAARFGIDSKFTWTGERKIPAADLIRQELLPLARTGLQNRQVDQQDINHYLGVIEERAERHMNGALWQLRAYNKLKKEAGKDEALSVLTTSILQNQSTDQPVARWCMPELIDLEEYRPVNLQVEEFMETDLFTVQKDDPIELVAELMDWRKIRYMPVEDSKGRLSGLITSRLLLRHFVNRGRQFGPAPSLVKEIMVEDPITVPPDTSIINAMRLMREHQMGCLPVVQNEELIGIITEMDFLNISARLIERLAVEPRLTKNPPANQPPKKTDH